MKNYNYVVIRKPFGHEIMSAKFAKAFNLPIAVISDKQTAEEYYADAAKTFENMKFFNKEIFIVPFEKRAEYLAQSWDVVADITGEKLDDELWLPFAATQLQANVTPKDVPVYNELKTADQDIVMLVFQKIITDHKCGLSAIQQSLDAEVFNFLYGKHFLVFGQHYHKVNDLPAVEKLADEKKLYVPGRTENPEVLGIRGVEHAKYWDMYRRLDKVVGIAGTHTWYMLALFPNTPHIILYNRNGVEHWGKIAEAFQRQGYPVYAIGYDETTDRNLLSQKIQSVFETL